METLNLKELPNKSSFVYWTLENETGAAVAIDEEGEIWVLMSPEDTGYGEFTNEKGKITTPTATKLMEKLKMRALSLRTGHNILVVEAEMKDNS